MDIQTWISTHNMYQHVDFSTQEYSEQLQSYLDLVILNIENLHVLPHAPLGKSDHIVIEGKLPTTNEPQHSARKGMTWCWKQANVHGLRRAIKDATWTDILDAKCANEAWTLFLDS